MGLDDDIFYQLLSIMTDESRDRVWIDDASLILESERFWLHHANVKDTKKHTDPNPNITRVEQLVEIISMSVTEFNRSMSKRRTFRDFFLSKKSGFHGRLGAKKNTTRCILSFKSSQFEGQFEKVRFW